MSEIFVSEFIDDEINVVDLFSSSDDELNEDLEIASVIVQKRKKRTTIKNYLEVCL